MGDHHAGRCSSSYIHVHASVGCGCAASAWPATHTHRIYIYIDHIEKVDTIYLHASVGCGRGASALRAGAERPATKQSGAARLTGLLVGPALARGVVERVARRAKHQHRAALARAVQRAVHRADLICRARVALVVTSIGGRRLLD